MWLVIRVLDSIKREYFIIVEILGYRVVLERKLYGVGVLFVRFRVVFVDFRRGFVVEIFVGGGNSFVVVRRFLFLL